MMHTVTVVQGDQRHTLTLPTGSNLRQALLAADLSPYTSLTRRLNCGGRGLCATCGVWIGERPQPTHWHDRLAQQYGYPRLSCQVTVDRDLTVYLLTEKLIWGSRQRGQGPG